MQDLTPKERLKQALKGGSVDRPPCICPGGMMNMIVEELMDITGSSWPEAHSDPRLMADLAAGVFENGGFENAGVPFCMTVEAEAMGAGVFMGTRVNEPRVRIYPLASVTEWRKLGRIDVNSARAAVVTDAITILKNRNPDIPVIANLTGPISLATSLMEPIVFYKELRKNPEAANEMLAFVSENLISFGRAQLEAGADVLAISDPSGTGELLGPAMFRKFAIPWLNTIIESLQPLADTGTIIHICGRLHRVYKELNMLMSDAISFDSVTRADQVAANVLSKVLMGNVSTFALDNSRPAAIKRIATACIQKGMTILSPACGIGPRTPLRNIQAMVEAARG